MKTMTAALSLSLLLGSTSFIAHAAPNDMDDDGVLNAYDPDLDGDGIPNLVEKGIGMRYRQVTDGAGDRDGDGWSNSQEYRFFTDIHDANNNRDLNTGPDIEKVFGFDASESSNFGFSVDVEGEWAVIGAPNAPTLQDPGGNAIEPVSTGAVYVYRRESGLWELQTKLTGLVEGPIGGQEEILSSSADFGQNVALTLMPGHAYPTVMATAPGIDSAFVFKSRQGTWQQSGIIEGPSGEDFGTSLDLDGSVAVIGAPTSMPDQGTPVLHGSAYIYDVKGTSDGSAPELVTELTFCETGTCAFGTDVALDGDTLVVSSVVDSFPNTISVYREVDGSWIQEQLLESSLATGSLGTSIALSGDRILVGEESGNLFQVTGNVYEFTRSGSTWTEEGAIFAADFGSDRIGISMDLDQDIVVLSDSDGFILGLMNIAGVWTELARDHAATSFDSLPDYLSVDATSGVVMIGAPDDNDAGSEAGASYFVDLNSLQ